MITPRARFRADPANKGWQDVADSTLFHRAAEAAFAEMGNRLNAPADMTTAAAHAWQLDGAKIFLATLMDLSLPDQAPSKPVRQNLDHNR